MYSGLDMIKNIVRSFAFQLKSFFYQLLQFIFSISNFCGHVKAQCESEET